jgi:hypothetical protein
MVLLIAGISLTGMEGRGEVVREPLAHSTHLTTTPTDILSMLQGVAILVEDDVGILRIIDATIAKMKGLVSDTIERLIAIVPVDIDQGRIVADTVR